MQERTHIKFRIEIWETRVDVEISVLRKEEKSTEDLVKKPKGTRRRIGTKIYEYIT